MHIYLDRQKTNSSLFTFQELIKLHKGFSHPSNYKIFNLLCLARPLKVDYEITSIRNDIVMPFRKCQHYGSFPIRFKATTPTVDNQMFGNKILVDFMFLNEKSVLYVVDTATRFSVETFLDPHGSTYGQSTEGIWIASLEC